MHTHRPAPDPAAESQMNPTMWVFVLTVVVGNVADPEEMNEEPQVIARAAVPLMRISSFCPSVGVPDRLVVIDVMASVCPVMLN